jgi:hypothetical protein
MELRIWKRIYLMPFIRLNLYTRGLTISFGHRGLGWTLSDGAGFAGLPGATRKIQIDFCIRPD